MEVFNYADSVYSGKSQVNKNSTVISFAASKDKSFDEYLLHPDEKKVLLPVLAIYGANAAGKVTYYMQ